MVVNTKAMRTLTSFRQNGWYCVGHSDFSPGHNKSVTTVFKCSDD